MQLTKNFHIDEFMCKDGTSVPWDKVENVRKLAENLQVLRDYLNAEGRPKGVPKEALILITVNSGFRNRTYNEKIDGAKNSQHIEAAAADIVSKWLTPFQIHTAILTLIKSGKMKDGGLSLYAGFVHYDIGPSRRWKQ